MAGSPGRPFETAETLIEYDPWTGMPGQLYDWTCSACSTEFVERATSCSRGDDVYSNREAVVYAIGYPDNINGNIGLADASGSELQRVLLEQTGRYSDHGYLSFDEVYALGEKQTPALMSGAQWYHWVAVRGVQGSTLWIANSAPGYKGVYDNLSREDFARLGGFSVVWLV
jgi:hypothetical protein